jgi:opacity protein-like surface antigen
MKKVLRSLVAVAVLAVAAFAANAENPLYAPAQLGFYSKTGFGWMYKKSDDNLAMKAKDWANETENPIPRISEDFGFGITNWLALRGAFGYTYDGDIDRSGMHQARLGLNFRVINSPAETVVWDIYADAFLGGVSKMKADLVKSNTKDTVIFAEQPISFNYENYGNGRWGVWVGTQVGKTFDKFTLSAFGEVERTFGNNNNEITIKESAVPVIGGLVHNSVKDGAIALGQAEATAEFLATRVAGIYTIDLQNNKKFSVDTKSTWEYAAGLKTLYEINNDWSLGGAFNWKHRATNSIEALNISISKEVDTNLENFFNGIGQPALINIINATSITEGVEKNFAGSMKDGVDEFAISLLGSRQLTDNLQLTLYGEYTFDTAEEKAQLGTNRKAEAGLRLNLQF